MHRWHKKLQMEGTHSSTRWNPEMFAKRRKWVFPKIGVPQNGSFIMENLIKLDDLGVPLFSETSKFYHLTSTTSLSTESLPQDPSSELSELNGGPKHELPTLEDVGWRETERGGFPGVLKDVFTKDKHREKHGMCLKSTWLFCESCFILTDVFTSTGVRMI